METAVVHENQAGREELSATGKAHILMGITI
jgi:hypothetical protein